MNSAVYCKGIKLIKQEFHSEKEFEEEVKNNSKKLFGEKTIYLDLKKKITSNFIGGAVPDGILFDLEDPEDIGFFLVEVELAKHNFYEHIFPQITKFFAFYKNPVSVNLLIESIHSFIKSDEEIENQFRNLLSGRELYKSIKDAVENGQRILLILDEEKFEIYEAQNVYTDTWDKMVIPEVLNKYKKGIEEVIILEPDFFAKEFLIESPGVEEESEKVTNYTENYHLSEINPSIITLYSTLKEAMVKLDSKIEFNAQKYYISFRRKRNFAYLDIKNKKIKIAVMLPYERGSEIIKNHRVRKFTEGVQKFYGRQSFEITLENNENLDEVLGLLEVAYREQEKE